jgi:rfaE bifunctional protein kinase chain/domain
MTGREAARARALIRRFRRVRLLVAGDLVADEFIYGQLDRVSREAPVLILKYSSTEIVPGGAGNAANNAAALGARVDVVGLVGRDGPGRRLIDALGRVASVTGVARAAGFVTPVKTRILAGGVHSAKQQVVRIDRAGGRITPAMASAFEAALVRGLRRASAVIVSDYGAGLLTPERWQRALAAAGARRPPLVLVDSRYALTQFSGMTACTPNEAEVEALAGSRIEDDPARLEQAGRRLLEALRCRAVLVTRGSRGMALFEAGKPTDHIPIVGSDEVADVTGAGDTVIASFTLALAAGATFGEAARLANHAGGLVVMKRGTATVGAEELLAAIAPLSRRGRRR